MATNHVTFRHYTCDSVVTNDADNSVFFRRELEHIKSQPIEVQRPDIRWRLLIPPARDPAPRGAEVITWYLYEKVGQAKFISAYETHLPRSDVFGKKMSSPVHSIGDSYGYNDEEIDAARHAGKPLQAWRREASMEAMERKLQDVAFKGEASLNIPGFFNNPNVATVGAAVSGGNTTWAAKLGAGDWRGVLADVANVLNAITENTNGREKANTFLLPLSEYNRVSQYFTGIEGNRTLLQAMKDAHPGVEFDYLIELDTASPAGGKLGIAYDRNPRVLGREVPMEPQESPVQDEGFDHVIPVRATTGGCPILYPAAVKYFTGF